MKLLTKARLYAGEKYQGQTYNDQPFIIHPAQTYRILEVIAPMDENLLAAAYLHDILENTPVRYEELRNEFNEDIADLVREVTKEGYNRFPHLKTPRGVLLKFADRLSNLASMHTKPKAWQEKYIEKSRFWKI